MILPLDEKSARAVQQALGPEGAGEIGDMLVSTPRSIKSNGSDDSSGSDPEVLSPNSGKITVVFGEPTDPQVLAMTKQSDVVTIHTNVGDVDDQADRSRAVSAPEFDQEDKRADQSQARTGNWCSKLCNKLLCCFSACRTKKSPKTSQTPGKRSYAYIFFKNRCIQVVISGAITLGAAGGSLYGAQRALDALFMIGGNTAILSEILLGGLLYTVFLVTAQLLICRMFECAPLPSERIMCSLGNAMLAAAPAGAARLWSTLYPMSLVGDPSLLVPVVVYNVLGVIYLVFGISKETCSPEPTMIFGKPLSDGYKIVLKNPFCAIQDAMNRRAAKIQQSQGGILEPFLCDQV